MLLAALLALTGWTIGAPPSGYELVAARQYDHEQVTRYGRPTPDPDDAPVALWAYDPGHSYPLASFYAVPLPTSAREVRVTDADRGTEIGPTGPVIGGSRADRRRCSG